MYGIKLLNFIGFEKKESKKFQLKNFEFLEVAFINLGGYKKGFFKEFHEQHLMVGTSMGEIIKKAKQTEFYKTMGFEGAVSHIDDKHGVDIDDIFNVNDILPLKMKEKYSIILIKTEAEKQENSTGLGYLKIDKV